MRADVNLAAIVAESRARCGLPLKVEDPAVLRRIATVLHQRDEAPATAAPGHSLNTVPTNANRTRQFDDTP